VNTDETCPEALLRELRAWGTSDMIWTNYDGERWWFKKVYHNGEHVGKSECCPESHPCDRHKNSSFRSGRTTMDARFKAEGSPE